jgi:hypothetical protein
VEAMAAPTGLEILVDEKHVNDLLQQRHGIKAVIRAALNNFCFVVFLALFTTLALGEPFGDMRAFEGYVRRRFDTAAAMPLDDVKSASSFWRYVNVSVLPAIYGNDTERYYYPGHQVETILPIEGSNRLFGVARFRMKKVLPNTDCSISEEYSSAFPTCYGPFHPDAEDKTGFGPVSNRGTPEFEWLAEPDGMDFDGKIAFYPSGGYMWVLTSNYNVSFYRTLLYEENDWVDAGTRAVFIDFTIYNFNLGLYAACRIAFEVAPSGRWFKTFDVTVFQQRSLSALGFGTAWEWCLLVFEGILILFVIRYLLEEASEFIGFEHRGQGKFPSKRPTIKWGYFLDAWNVLDWLNLILMVVTIGYRISTWSVASRLQVYIGNPADQDLSTFTDMSGVARNVILIRNLFAFNSVLTWFKAVKYINLFPYISTFMQTVSMSQRQLSTFVVVLMIVIMGFILGFHVAFGEQQPEFRTPWRAFLFVMRSFIGNADMEVIYQTAPFLGALLIMLYVVVMVFVVMNLFYAIMISALADAKRVEDLKSEKKWQQQVERARDLWDGIYESWRLEHRFRTCVPGLYARLMKKKQKREEHEMMRDAAYLYKQQHHHQLADDLKDLGPGSPMWGRRKQRKLQGLEAAKEGEDSSSGSEADLGPLRNEDQVTRRAIENKSGNRSPKGGPARLDSADSFDSVDSDEDKKQTEPTAQAIDLVIDATRYVANTVVTRTEGARGVLFAEMGESKEVLQGIGSVLEVLSRRVGDLQAQQNNLLLHF